VALVRLLGRLLCANLVLHLLVLLFRQTQLNLVGDGRELEDPNALIEARQARIEVDNHFDHATAFKVGLEQSGQLADPVGNLLLVGARFLVVDHCVYAAGQGEK